MATKVSSEHLRLLRLLDTPTIADAMETFGIRDRTEGFTGATIQCLSTINPSAVMVGHAVTVVIDTTTPGQQLAGFDDLLPLWQAVESAQKPCVIACQHIDLDVGRSCVFGDVKARIAHRLGAIGLVTNGGIRDLTGMSALGFQVFARGVVPAHGNSHVVSVSQPIVIDGMPIRNGDLLHGDSNGVVVVPALTDLTVLLAEAGRIRQREGRLLEYINSTGFLLSQLPFVASADAR